MSDKDNFIALVHSNINKYGYHVTVVNSAIEPRYAYTIGLSKILGFELVFAGGVCYMKEELLTIFESLVRELKIRKNQNLKFNIESLGEFSLSIVRPSWSRLMMLGVFDSFHQENINALQILPDHHHSTIDIPDMSKEFDISTENVWQWLVREWTYQVPMNSSVITDLKVLKGEIVTEMTRWEETEWEMYSASGPDIPKQDKRVVSLGTLLSIDNSLEPALKLEIGKGMWRDKSVLKWHNWE